ncbi:hypothetical protein ACOI22_09765 [Glaciecola sp. 2405UD65-10]|uniref:hypothetical protein n=1 Tax=Glaciecola sp. 2405UD65-10 TaxID=3397244 RepID=UPI003B5B2825
MARWHQEFKQHGFQKYWQNIKETLSELKVDDESITTDLEEMARFKKVIRFISNLIDACDPELVPTSIWQNFQNQCQQCINELHNYKSNRNIGHITNANANADNLLTYIRPYVVSESDAAKAATLAYKEYQKSIRDGLQGFKDDALEYEREFKAIAVDLRDQKIEFNELFEKLKNTDDVIDELRKKYFEGTDENEAIAEKINEMVETLERHHLQISDYYGELIESGSTSIASKIEVAKSSSQKNASKIEELLHEVQEDLGELKLFYNDVMGLEDKEGNLNGGLKAELKQRQDALDNFKNQQETRYKALNEQIEQLLPGATSAGLASAFKEMKDSFMKPIKFNSILFYVSIGLLVVTAFVSTVDSFWTENEVIKFIDITDLKNLLSNLSHKLPVILPVLWLAIFASKRRSEAQRLQQEYAHKEAISKSYQNFKRQIDELQDGRKEELLEQLLGAAIEAVSSNSSATLDKRHGDNTPAHEALEKSATQLEKIKSVFNK